MTGASPLRRLGHRLRSTDNRLVWLPVALLCRLLAATTGSARWHQRLGGAYERLGRGSAARSAYHRAATTPGRDPEWVLRLGRSYERAGDWGAATGLYREAVADEPRRPVFHARLARACATSGDWDAAAEHYRTLADLDQRAEPRARLAEALERLDDLRGAATAYEEALERDPHQVDWLLRLGRIRVRLREDARALAAFGRALEVAGDDAPSRLRLDLAQVHERLGRWSAALALVEENVIQHPAHAPSHRARSRLAASVWRWNGVFEADDAVTAAPRFRSLAEGRERGDEADRWLTVACRAMERALLLEPTRAAWKATLGDLRLAAGYPAGAIESYADAVDWARAADDRSVFKSLHAWQFALERAHHAAGAPRVVDPLFDIRARLVTDPPSPGEQPVGFFRVQWTFGGLAVTGFVADAEATVVEIHLDDQLLRTVNLADDRPHRQFAADVLRSTLEHFPRRSTLRVRTAAGGQLLAEGRGRAIDLEVPHGIGDLARLLSEGRQVDKKGAISPSPQELRTLQEAHLRLYERGRWAFDELVGTPLFAVYGTLLGLHRDGDLIPGDDDVDTAYVSSATDPRSVKEEAAQIMARLVRAGYTVSFNRSGRLFRLHHEPTTGFDIHLDVHPLWFQDGRLWMHNHASFEGTVDDILPVERRQLRGVEVLVPRRPETFLERNYGPGWRVPDPGFAYHPGQVAPWIRANLRQALIRPREYAELRARLEQDPAPGQGRLVSIGSGSLYPLERFVP